MKKKRTKSVQKRGAKQRNVKQQEQNQQEKGIRRGEVNLLHPATRKREQKKGRERKKKKTGAART